MPAVSHNFQIEQGSHFEINFQYLNEQNEPINLANKCIILRWLEANTNNVVTFSSSTTASIDNSSGYSLVGNDLGIINFQISSSQTKTYEFTTAIYDLDVVENSGTGNSKNIRLVTGTIGCLLYTSPSPRDS